MRDLSILLYLWIKSVSQLQHQHASGFPCGVTGAEKIQALYGIHLRDPNLEILMRHRAILFGLLGLFTGFAAFQPGLQALALLRICQRQDFCRNCMEHGRV